MASEEWVRVASASDVKPGAILRVIVGDDQVALANADGELYAVDNVCTHEYAELHEGWIEDCLIECPLHGSRFDLRTGMVQSLPAVHALPLYEVKVEGEDVFVRGPVKNVRE